MEMDLSADMADVRLVSGDMGEVMRAELGLEGEARGVSVVLERGVNRAATQGV